MSSRCWIAMLFVAVPYLASDGGVMQRAWLIFLQPVHLELQISGDRGDLTEAAVVSRLRACGTALLCVCVCVCVCVCPACVLRVCAACLCVCPACLCVCVCVSDIGVVVGRWVYSRAPARVAEERPAAQAVRTHLTSITSASMARERPLLLRGRRPCRRRHRSGRRRRRRQSGRPLRLRRRRQLLLPPLPPRRRPPCCRHRL